MDSPTHKIKLKMLFDKLLTENYILDNYYAENFLTRLTNEEDKDMNEILESTILPELISRTTKISKTTYSVKTFFIRLLAILVKNELHYTKLFHAKAFDILMDLVDCSDPKVNAPIKCAYLNILINLLTHSSGTNWIIEKKIFKEVKKLCYMRQTIYIVRAANEFLNKYLWKLNDLGEEAHLVEVIEFVFEPIFHNKVLKNNELFEKDIEQLTASIEPGLDILIETLNLSDQSKPLLLLNLLYKRYNISFYLLSYINISRDENCIIKLSKILFVIGNESVKHENPDDAIIEESSPVLYTVVMQTMIQKKLLRSIVEFSFFCCRQWAKLNKNDYMKTFEANGKEFYVFNQFVYLAMIPILCSIPASYFTKDIANNRVVQYAMKWFDISCEHSTRVAYGIRNILLETQDLRFSLYAMKSFSTIVGQLNQSLANTIYQGLHYILCYYIPLEEIDHCFTEHGSLFDNVEFVTSLLEGIYLLLSHHNINWHQSYEVVYLYTTINNILKTPNVPSKLNILTLKLLKICITKFLQPNMALLVESDKGSPIEELGSILYTKLHHTSWEIKDSALEVLVTCVDLSYIKYTPFQKMIIENKLMPLVHTLAVNDPEIYVKATAVKCLTYASKVHSIWDDLIRSVPDLTEKTIDLLASNAEGIVRKETVLYHSEVMSRHKLSPAVLQKLYRLMTSISIDDLHSEVQVGALSFWRAVIQEALKQEGMIDGSFPQVTFSKEKKKIVKIDEIEIKRRLLKVLNELAMNGCLKALVETANVDSEVSVLCKSVEVAKELINILVKHNLTSISDDLIEFVPEPCDEKVEFTEPVANAPGLRSAGELESVMEGILNSKDVNILAEMYEYKMNCDSQPERHADRPSSFYYCSPKVLMQKFYNVNYEDLIEEKRNWNSGIRDLNSLIDDIVGCYDITSINELDCY